MTLEQIEYYVTAVDRGSFSAAAEELFVSHSSVSRGVSVLENELGVRLLDRGKRKLTCTDAGEVFYRKGKALLQQTRALRECVDEFRERQKLRLVSIGVYAPRLYELIRAFHKTHPSVEIDLRQEDQQAATARLRDGGADLCVTFSYSLPGDGGFSSIVLEQGRFCALVSPGHELAEREVLTERELTGRRDILGENPFHPDEGTAQTRAARDLRSDLLQIKTGSGVTILPEHAAAEFGQGCVRIPIRGERTEYQLVLAWKRENGSRALAEAVAFFRERLEQTE